ncbi:hypothetical protein PDESU_03916 [Pontiella desulfatans]|uniref:Uncharacterized protein n=1 Tax=Pontiella desulfatans TaxID=2750659 RepID=A0A6C2U614_PONDE|nr:hypothetical protein [Pontiella desulfatans]VGO15333.1 hypothetical protein PDESU_03916 [Pontiella desulfatans]
MSRPDPFFAMLAALLAVASVHAANQEWDSGGGADQDWATAANWGGDLPDTVPAAADAVVIGDGGTAVYSAASGTESVQRTQVNGGSTLKITGGSLSHTQTGSATRNNVGAGSAGTVNQSGGIHVVAHQLRVGSGSGGDGTYELSGGDLRVTRGGSSGVSGSSTSIDIGVDGGAGLLKVSGGSLETRVGVGIGANGTFRIEGGAASSIAIGSNGSGDGHWKQDSGGVLDLRVDANGLTPIFIDQVDGTGAGGDVVFAEGALLDVGFLGGLNTFGVWDAMQWEGILTDGGLDFAAGVDTSQWSFAFVDTTASGQADTLRIQSVASNDGTWIDATNSAVSWTDHSKWSDGTVAYGSGKTALFELNHTTGKVVDLPTDIVIGTIRYRDNGEVNRSMVIESANGSKLIMAATNSAPLIWARNKDITVDVVLAGTNGLELASSIILKQRNTYSGTTTIRDASGTVKTTYPGDFGASDLTVLGSVYVDHSQVLVPSATLMLETGATMELGFAGVLPAEADFADLFVSGLTLDGVAQPDGVYSASTHPAYFAGTGEIVVRPFRDGFPLALNETNALVWPSQAANLYEVHEASNLGSNDWTNLATVAATPPTNVFGTGATGDAAGFFRVVERPDYLPTVRAGVMAKLDSLVSNNYLVDQNLNTATNRHGQFHNSDNMRMSECTPVLVWCYMQPDSAHYQNPEVLNRAIWSVDYMCRAQGINGGFNEYHGWCGVPDRTNGKSSVLGFTMHAIGNAVERMCNLPEMNARLSEPMDPNGTGSNDTERRVAWKTMLAAAMENQFSGSGRGHAPNQDLCALMGVYAINGAYAALDGGTSLKTQAEIDALSNEIFYGYPSAASSNPNGQWFSSTGMLGEHGHADYGYDGNYGVKVCFRYLGVLAPHDPTAATFLSTKFADAMQYFFVADAAAPLGVFAENGIARRSTGDPMDPTMSVIGCAAGYHPSLDRLYDIMLPHFASAPVANMKFTSPHHLQIGVWAYCEWLDKISEPANTGYRLPAEQSAAWEFRDTTMKLLATKPVDGVPTYYTEIWDTADQARRHVTGQAAETIDSLYEF